MGGQREVIVLVALLVILILLGVAPAGASDLLVASEGTDQVLRYELGCISEANRSARGGIVMSSKVDRSATRVRGFDDPELEFQLIRILGMAPYGAPPSGNV